jgi:hypothetical protein
MILFRIVGSNQGISEIHSMLFCQQYVLLMTLIRPTDWAAPIWKGGIILWPLAILNQTEANLN